MEQNPHIYTNQWLGSLGLFRPRIFTEDNILANLSLHSQLTTLGNAWPTLHTHLKIVRLCLFG